MARRGRAARCPHRSTARSRSRRASTERTRRCPAAPYWPSGAAKTAPPEAGEDCARECQRGCPPRPSAPSSARYEAFWISADGVVTALNLPIRAGHPSLLPGSDGSPWLIADNAELYRFDPWRADFEPAGTELGLDGALSPPRFVAMGPDSFAWLSDDAQGVVLGGVRLGTRSAFSNDVPLVTPRDPNDPSRPAHLVPDHATERRAELRRRLWGARVRRQYERDGQDLRLDQRRAVRAIFPAEFAFSSSESPSLRLGSSEFVDPEAHDTSGSCALPALAGRQRGRAHSARARGKSRHADARKRTQRVLDQRRASAGRRVRERPRPGTRDVGERQAQ